MFAAGRALIDETVLDRRVAELAICTTCAYWRANYPYCPHAPLARELGVPDEVFAALEAGEEPRLADQRDQLVYDFAVTLAESGTVEEDLHQRAAACFGERELVELVITCAWYTMMAYIVNAFEDPTPMGLSPVWAESGRRDPANGRS
jgi:4-carboxymuconolactone decarboxylase